MANEFKVRKGLIVEGSGSAVLDIQGSQGQLFSITDDLTGDIFSISDISGVPILNVNADGTTTIDGTLTLTTDETLDSTSDTSIKFLTRDSNGVVKYHTLGSNAFNSTSFATGDNFDADGTFASLRAQGTTKGDVGLGSVENTAISTFAGSSNITTLGTIGTGTWNGTAIADAYLSSNTAHLSGTQTFSGAKTFSSLSSFTMDGNTITGIDDSGEFTDNDAHIMTSAGVNDRITSFGYTTNTGTLTGNGTSTYIPFYNGTTSFGNTNKLVWNGTKLTTAGLNIAIETAQNSEATSLMINSSGDVGTRELGSNAFNSTSFTTNTGTLTGNGTSGRIPIYNGTTSFTTDSGFTYSSNILSIDGVLRANGVPIIDHSTARTILIGDTTDSDEIDAIKFVVMAGDNIVLTDGETAVNSALKLPSLSAQNSEATALMKNGSNVVGYRELGSNAFNSTSIPSLSGNVTVGGDLTVSGNQVITAGSNADVKFSVWNGTTYGIGMTSGVTLGGLNDYAMTFCMNNDSDRGFWWGYNGQAKSAGAMSLTTGGSLYVSTQVQAQETYIARDSYFERLVTLNNVSESETSTKALVWADDSTIEFRGLGTAAFSSVLTGDGNYGMTTSGTQIRMENDRRRNSSSTDIYTGNTHDYVFFDASHGMRFYTSGAEEMRLEDDGDLHVDGDVIAFSSTVSDERLKDNVTTIENPLDKIKALRGVEYDWNDGSRKGKHDLGLIAQEVEKVIPNIVHEHQMPLLNDDEEDETLYKTVDYEKLTAVLIEGMKEQQNQIDSLKSELAKIKGSL